jgi:hypothetical protein
MEQQDVEWTSKRDFFLHVFITCLNTSNQLDLMDDRAITQKGFLS